MNWFSLASSLLPALLGSAAAILIATNVYKKQKDQDRQNEIMRELRACLVAYVQSVEKCRLMMQADAEIPDHLTYQEYIAPVNIAYLHLYSIAPDEIVKAVAKHEIYLRMLARSIFDSSSMLNLRKSDQFKEIRDDEIESWSMLLSEIRKTFQAQSQEKPGLIGKDSIEEA